MKRCMPLFLIVLLTVAAIPASAGHGTITYGVIVEPVPRIGPLTVETQDGYLISAQAQPYESSDDLYLGAQVAMQWDGTSLYIIHESIQPKSILDKKQWVGQISSYNPEHFSFFITSPDGDLRVFVPPSLIHNNDFACNSIISISALKDVWKEQYIAEEISVITR